MAAAVARGVGEPRLRRAELRLCELRDSDLRDELELADLVLVGTATINRDAPPQVWHALSLFSLVTPKAKVAAVFGSFGWSGEAVKMVEERLQGLRFKLAVPGLSVRFRRPRRISGLPGFRAEAAWRSANAAEIPTCPDLSWALPTNAGAGTRCRAALSRCCSPDRNPRPRMVFPDRRQNRRHRAPRQLLSYRIPEELRSVLQVGHRVRVPLGRRTAIGYVFALAMEDRPGLRALLELLDDQPLFAARLAAFYERAARYYAYPLGEAIRTALPAGLSGRGKPATVLHESVLSSGPPLTVSRAVRCNGQLLAFLRDAGGASLSALRRQFPAPHAALRRLVALGLLTVEKVERSRDPLAKPRWSLPADVCSNPAQAQALEKICAQPWAVVALPRFCCTG